MVRRAHSNCRGLRDVARRRGRESPLTGDGARSRPCAVRHSLLPPVVSRRHEHRDPVLLFRLPPHPGRCRRRGEGGGRIRSGRARSSSSRRGDGSSSRCTGAKGNHMLVPSSSIDDPKFTLNHRYATATGPLVVEAGSSPPPRAIESPDPRRYCRDDLVVCRECRSRGLAGEGLHVGRVFRFVRALFRPRSGVPRAVDAGAVKWRRCWPRARGSTSLPARSRAVRRSASV